MTMDTKPEEIEERVQRVHALLKDRIPVDTRIAIILGTGLGGLADRVQDCVLHLLSRPALIPSFDR